MELRLLPSLGDVAAADWDALNRGEHPFTAHAFLHGLESHACLDAEYGWTPLHATLWDAGTLVAAAPAYAKGNSHGEFVFDNAWANAYSRYGLPYYPKWLIGVPYTPVTGPRLLARAPEYRPMLLSAMREAATSMGLHSIHANFVDAADLDAFDESWLQRSDVQFQWRRQAGWANFDDFLAALNHKKRKNLKAERRRVEAAGVTLRVLQGAAAAGAPMASMHRFYRQTFAEKWNHAAMTEAFFQHLCQAMPEAVVLVLAERNGEPVAGALCLQGGDALYGRYWGCEEEIPGLHFEACYHQGIAWCLEHGLARFEPGAQGEHKIARGFLPVATHSRHWLAEPRFHEALGRWCAEEREASRRYGEAVLAHSPYRSDAD